MHKKNMAEEVKQEQNMAMAELMQMLKSQIQAPQSQQASFGFGGTTPQFSADLSEVRLTAQVSDGNRHFDAYCTLSVKGVDLSNIEQFLIWLVQNGFPVKIYYTKQNGGKKF